MVSERYVSVFVVNGEPHGMKPLLHAVIVGALVIAVSGAESVREGQEPSRGADTSGGARVQGTASDQRPVAGDVEHSLDWMIGRWEWTEKSKLGYADPVLQSLARLCVFPFVDYQRVPQTNGVDIAAEFQIMAPDGKLEPLPRYPYVTVYQGGVLCHGLGSTAFQFRYAHGEQGGRSWLELREVTSTTNQFRIRFEKVSCDPGKPLSLERIKSWIPNSRIEDYNRDYRKRMGLSDQPVEGQPAQVEGNGVKY